jgi:hypothetical protein
VIVAPDLAGEEPAVDVLALDGARLRWRLLGLALVDSASGRSLLLAEPKPCKAEWVDPVTILWRDALDPVVCEVRVTLLLAGVETDVVFRENLPPELVAKLGLDPRATRVLILTEFIDPPEASTERRLSAPDRHNPSQLDTDDDVSFGFLRIGAGRTFSLDSPDGPSVPVRKSWETLSGRQCLVEQMDYPALGPLIETLPEPDSVRIESLKAKAARTAAVDPAGGRDWRAALRLPAREVRQARTEAPRFDQGRLILPEQAVVSA